jgi:hypothetical protein
VAGIEPLALLLFNSQYFSASRLYDLAFDNNTIGEMNPIQPILAAATQDFPAIVQFKVEVPTCRMAS